MTFEFTGKHLVAGDWISSDSTFENAPVEGSPLTFFQGTEAIVDRAAEAAEDAFWTYGYTTRAERAAFLNTIADEIDARADAITDIGTRETGLPPVRLQGERGRTTGQLRLFAKHILDGDYLDRRHDTALPDRAPLPRPDLKMIQQPIGPVAVFGASNFPLAFSTAGGDTAAALAAGCPVVVKAHGAHPGTSEVVASAIHAAITAHGMAPGVFSMVQGGNRSVGTSLVQHPRIKAVGFTGSLRGGRALFDLCAARPEPIPFFGELGSVNPVFVLAEAAKARGGDIAKAWAGSLTMGAGQFCTNPGIVVIDEDGAETFVNAARSALEEIGPQTMLTDGIASAFQHGQEAMEASVGLSPVVQSTVGPRNAGPFVYETDVETWLSNPTLAEEVFGPLGVIVKTKGPSDMKRVAQSLEGQLTLTLQMDDGDLDVAASLMPLLVRKAGRILANGFPTGVEVADSMVHGGPYPASTNFGATSVGTLSIRRFLRPVCFQNLDARLLHESF